MSAQSVLKNMLLEAMESALKQVTSAKLTIRIQDFVQVAILGLWSSMANVKQGPKINSVEWFRMVCVLCATQDISPAVKAHA